MAGPLSELPYGAIHFRMVELIDPDERSRPTARRRGRPAGPSTVPAGQVQSLDRAFNLLEVISGHAHGIALTELAQRTGLPPSTAHRLLKSLEQRSYLRQDEERGLWFIGVKAFVVGSAFIRSRDIVAIARPPMRRLVEDLGESANLAVLESGEAIYLSQIECRQMIRAHALPGGRAPLHGSGVGKALLAALAPERAEALVTGLLMPALTPNTLTTRKGLLAALNVVRRAGYAVDDEEQSLGMRCVAAAIFDENAEPVAAVSITGPSARVSTERIDGIGARVRAAAEEITDAIGGLRRDGD